LALRNATWHYTADWINHIKATWHATLSNFAIPKLKNLLPVGIEPWSLQQIPTIIPLEQAFFCVILWKTSSIKDQISHAISLKWIKIWRLFITPSFPLLNLIFYLKPSQTFLISLPIITQIPYLSSQSI
jgi:hypothetical protein